MGVAPPLLDDVDTDIFHPVRHEVRRVFTAALRECWMPFKVCPQKCRIRKLWSGRRITGFCSGSSRCLREPRDGTGIFHMKASASCEAMGMEAADPILKIKTAAVIAGQ